MTTVQALKYLGSIIIFSDETFDNEVTARICKASQNLGRQHVQVLNQHNIRQSTKLKVYKTIVTTSLLYGMDVRFRLCTEGTCNSWNNSSKICTA